MESYSVVLSEAMQEKLCRHLLRPDSQEDLCFVTYVPSLGSKRFAGILNQLILPEEGERVVHGNVAFQPHYFERVMKQAAERKEGVVFLHSHPAPGWQGMSGDDVVAEERLAPSVQGLVGQPLLGMTLGSDGAWSGRFWNKVPGRRRAYRCQWCETVRVVGRRLMVTFNENILAPAIDYQTQCRTLSAWGERTQRELSMLRIGIVGLGSVGSIVAEILARLGIAHFSLIDFDSVELKNLDRLTNVFKRDVGRAKVQAVRDGILRSASVPEVDVTCCEYSVCEEDGYREALNCDIIFCCVDRPWARQVLNSIAYTHFIPVVDGGITVRTTKDNTRLLGADWKAQTVGVGRVCLQCLGQYKTHNAGLEKQGLLDDSTYIQGLGEGRNPLDADENVYAFSSHLASLEVLQMLSLYLAPSGVGDIGQQIHHFVLGRMDVEFGKQCDRNCYFQTVIGGGDALSLEVFGKHSVAERARQGRQRRKVGILESAIYKVFSSLLRKKRNDVKAGKEGK